MPVGADPTAIETTALATALAEYAQRSDPDDCSSLTGFVAAYPTSAWNTALLTNLGLEYYNMGYYSKTLEVWSQAWELAKNVTELKGKAIADRAVGELAYMYARLGRITELRTLLKSVEDRAFSGSATERITGAREGLWTMENRPEVAFLCGSFALRCIKFCLDPTNPSTELIQAFVSTHRGCSLLQIAELSQGLGLYFQMAFREADAAFVVPSVIHLKVDHFAAITRQEGDRYLLQDPTFGNDAWVTREALEAETSGYFLIPHGELGHGWRAVEVQEGETVWGKGSTSFSDPDPHGPCDPATPTGGGNSCPKNDDCKGLAVPRVHLMLVSLNINDEPVGYTPPAGPAVRFTVRYNQREARQPSIFAYSNFGSKWTFDWLSYITDNPSTPLADVNYYIMGGGTRTFRDFSTDSQTFAFQQFDQTKLTRTSPDTYEMLSRDGTRKVFSQSDGSIGSSRKIFLAQIIDPYGNAVSLTYDANLRVVTITDAIGQATSISYDHPTDIFKITKVTDPFGRFATFDYDASNRVIKITDVIGLTSEFTYDVDGADGSKSDFIVKLKTPYGETLFTRTTIDKNRTLETTYSDGDRDRVEYEFPGDASGLVKDVPQGMDIERAWHGVRNTGYWSKKAYSSAYPDTAKAKIYHWLHDSYHGSTTSGILETVKEPLERRVWYGYTRQSRGPSYGGDTNKPSKVGRVLDDGSTQLYTYEYNDFGNVTKTIDPVGRTFSYLYAPNGIDLLETRQTYSGQNELLSKMTYNAQHLPLTATDAAGQMTTYTYNARGQVLTKTNAKNETIAYNYDANGHLTSIEGPLPGSSITFTYDSVSRVKTKTDESGYTLTFDYDDLDRLTKIAFPDGTSNQYTYTLLDLTLIKDRAGRQTTFEYNSIRQMTKRTDPLNRVTWFQWCKCGALKSLTDPMGRTTTWRHDIQGRVKSKEYVDGSQITYRYDNSSRLKQRIDEKLQVTQYDYNRDDTISRLTYNNAIVATPPVAFAYDANYSRLHSMTDGTGTTRYDYIPISAIPSLGAGQLAVVDGPLPNDAITFGYDELGRRVSTAINGVAASVTYDAGGRLITSTNALGVFNTTYDGNSFRQASQTYPNGQTTEFSYAGKVQDQHLQKITHKLGNTPISEFIYGHEVPTGQVTSWSQQAGMQTPSFSSFTYDAVNQLLSASVAEGGNVVKTFSYSYDPASNRLTEQIDATIRQFSYNALNQLTSIEGDASPPATYQWDAEQRLVSVSSGNQETQFAYDGLGRRVGIRHLVGGAEVSNRRFVWCDNKICEERISTGAVSKRYFPQGMKVETGAATGIFYHTSDHLGSIRELTDGGGNVRASYSYSPFGDRTHRIGDLETDFGFSGMFWMPETELNLTWFRAYAAHIGRWLSRDPLKDAETLIGPNLYAYVDNNPINFIDPLGLKNIDPNGPCCVNEAESAKLAVLTEAAGCGGFVVSKTWPAALACALTSLNFRNALRVLMECLKNCPDPASPEPCEPIKFGPFTRP